jgi:tetratricopeptide (TPR) repeat protein
MQQQYRVNYRLLTILTVCGLVASVGSWGLWKFQVNRNAGKLLSRAELAKTSGDLKQALDSLYQYTRLRKDEPDAVVRLGETAVEISKESDIDVNTRTDAYRILVECVRQSEDPKLRRSLAELQAMYGMHDLALQNADELLDAGKGDAELMVLKARCLFANQKSAEAVAWCNKLIGYDPKTDAFDASQGLAPKEPLIYAYLASHLQSNRQPELARRVTDQLVEANADSAKAYLFRYRILKSMSRAGTDLEDEELEGLALESLAKAFEIEPDDADIVAAKGAESLMSYMEKIADSVKENDESLKEQAQKDLVEAKRMFAEGLEKHPDRIDFYVQVARLEMMQENNQAALDVIDRGIAKFPLKTALNLLGIPAAIDLEMYKFDILFAEEAKQRTFDGVKKEIAMLRRLRNTTVVPLADFQELRITAVQEKWAEAARGLQDVKARLLSFPDQQGLASAIQGFCHQQLGQDDLALTAFEYAIQKNPHLPQAQNAIAAIRQKIGQPGEETSTVRLDEQVHELLALPESQQDWTSFDEKIDEFIEAQAEGRGYSKDWVESRKCLLRAQTLVMRAEAAKSEEARKTLYQEARTQIGKAYTLQPDDLNVQLATAKLLLTEPGRGPEIALKRLDQILTKRDDLPVFRVLRAEIYAAMGGDKLVENLNSVSEGLEDWTPAQQAEVWTAVGAQFERLGKIGDAVRCISRAADLSPNGLPIRMALFNLALKQGNDEEMRTAQEKILEIVKDQKDPDYVLTEAKRRMVAFAKGEVDAAEAKAFRQMLDAAIKVRPSYSDLYLARGQFALIVEHDVESALKDFDEALNRGQANYTAVALQVKLLAERGRLQEARDRMERMPMSMWSAYLDRVGPMVLEQSGETERALSEAEKVRDANPQDPTVQTWFGEMAMRLKKFDVAEKALRQAVDLNNGDPDAWTRLVGLYMQMQRFEDVESVMREAHLALDEEYLPVLMGKYYELRSRWQEAETIYRAAYKGREDDLNVARRLAEFYLTWYGQSDANAAKSATFLNKILRAVNDGKLERDSPTASWARRQAARILANSGDYQNSLKAEKLLQAGADEKGRISAEEEDQLIDVLERRGTPEANLRLAELLHGIQASRGLTPEQDLKLGKALFAVGDVAGGKAHFENAIGRSPRNAALRTTFDRLLIDRKDVEGAERWLARMDEADVSPAEVAELRLRLAAAKGDKDEVREQLKSRTPSMTALTEEKLRALRMLALSADELGDHEYAITLMREFVRRSPGSEMELARMAALHDAIDPAIDVLNQTFPQRMEETASIAVEMLRQRRSEAPQKLDEMVERMVRAVRRDDPEAARYMVLEAEMLEIQEKYDESLEAYKRVLASSDLPRLAEATAANNLAFILALKKQDGELALKSVERAIKLVGPISDILDTRGLVLASLGKYAEAAEDFRLSAKSGPTPSKFFHLTQALLAADDQAGAAEAWAEAVAAGLGPERIAPMEVPAYEELVKKMGAAPQAEGQL